MNWREKAVDEKLSSFCYLFHQHIKTTQRSWFWWEFLQYARTNCFNCSDLRYKSLFGSYLSIVSAQ